MRPGRPAELIVVRTHKLGTHAAIEANAKFPHADRTGRFSIEVNVNL
jgi:hypothetical protein